MTGSDSGGGGQVPDPLLTFADGDFIIELSSSILGDSSYYTTLSKALEPEVQRKQSDLSLTYLILSDQRLPR